MTMILACSEKEDLAREIFSAARDLATQLGCEAALVELDEMKPSVKVGGKVILLKASKLLSNDPELATTAITEFAKKGDVPILLFGTTRFGRQVAAQTAVRMRLPALSDVKDLKIEHGKLKGTRMVYGGKFTARISATLPCIATIQAGSYQSDTGTPSSVESITVSVPSARTTHLGIKQTPKTSANLSSAPIIVSVGRGFKTKEDLAMAMDLAKTIGGIIGCSRPLASDLGWLSEDQHIGLTGIHVSPKLYVAVGISGQLQHTAGIKNSKIIVAINNDKQAPIFQIADYGIIGDLYQVIPELTKLMASASTSK